MSVKFTVGDIIKAKELHCTGGGPCMVLIKKDCIARVVKVEDNGFLGETEYGTPIYGHSPMWIISDVPFTKKW